jgi:hypothetical protein
MTAPEHEPTEQETALYEAMSAGDTAAIDDLRDTALGKTADTPVDEEPVAESEPDPEPADPAVQFETDLQNAWRRYQADNEDDEPTRMQNAKAAAKAENTAAAKATKAYEDERAAVLEANAETERLLSEEMERIADLNRASGTS